MLTARDIYINLYNLGSPKQLSFVHGSNWSILISDPHHDLCKHFWLAGSKVLNIGNINILGCPTFVSDLKNNIKFGIIWEDLKKPTLQLICLLKFISCLGLFLISFITQLDFPITTISSDLFKRFLIPHFKEFRNLYTNKFIYWKMKKCFSSKYLLLSCLLLFNLFGFHNSSCRWHLFKVYTTLWIIK